jgi:hypothetical protein
MGIWSGPFGSPQQQALQFALACQLDLAQPPASEFG